jgi:FKBP-type peptidyl-prolyl cis-trans isomerase FkpA
MSNTTVPIQPIAKGSMLKLWGGLGVLALGAIGLAYAGAGKAPPGSCLASDMTPEKGAIKAFTRTESGLLFQTIKPGKGAMPTEADVALINYKGQLRGGTVFDANSNAPLPVGRMIPGFSEGLKLMQRGGSYRLCIPSAIGYGEQANERIPANSALIFDVELLDFRSEAEVQAMQQMMQQQQGKGGAGAPGAPPMPPQ